MTECHHDCDLCRTLNEMDADDAPTPPDALREAVTHAAAVLNSCGDIYFHSGCKEAGAALRAALAQPKEADRE